MDCLTGPYRQLNLLLLSGGAAVLPSLVDLRAAFPALLLLGPSQSACVYLRLTAPWRAPASHMSSGSMSTNRIETHSSERASVRDEVMGSASSPSTTLSTAFRTPHDAF